MQWVAEPSSLKPRRYEIKHDPSAGFYLFVFENDKCIRDHLQDTLEMAIECAWEDHGVSKSEWQKVEE